MRTHTIPTMLILCTIAISLHAEKHRSQVALSENYNWTSWGNNHLPESSGLKLSNRFGGISFTGRYASYTGADTWYITYGTDGTMYSCWTDGNVNGIGTGSPSPRAAKIWGTDPLNLSVEVVGDAVQHGGSNGPTGRYPFGRYPCGQLMYNDIWYYGTYLLEQNDRSMFVPHADWPILQPFIGLRVSDNFGESWYDKTEPDDPIFENAHGKWVDAHGVEFNPYEILIGAPHFVDFGDNMQNAPVDPATGRKWAYMVAHGADAGSTLSHVSWISGDNIYLIRILLPEGKNVEENFRYMNTPSNWQYLSKDGSYKAWNRDNLQEVYANIQPIVHSKGFLGNVGMVYDAPLKKFIMTLSRTDNNSRDFFDAMILESDAIDGEYGVVQYLKGFATVSYFMNISSRFISEDGRTMWLCYSSNYNCLNHPLPTIGGSQYSLCLTEMTLDGLEEAKAKKYEGEGMSRLEHAALKVDPLYSNGASMADITRLGDGVEFYSKSKGNGLAIAQAHGACYTHQISVLVNDRKVKEWVVTPSGDWMNPTLNFLDVDIHRGDKVTLRIEPSDIAYNSLWGELNEDGTRNFDTTFQNFGNIDYVMVLNAECHEGEFLKKKGEQTATFTITSEADTTQTFFLNYSSAYQRGQRILRPLVMKMNKEKGQEILLTATNTDSDYTSKALNIKLKKGKNILTFSQKEGEPEVKFGSMWQTEYMELPIDGEAGFVDGYCDACRMKLGGSACRMSCHPGYTGKGFVAGLDKPKQTASVGVKANVESGDYELTIRYSAGEVSGTTLKDRRILSLTVGEETTEQEFELTDSWQEWKEKKLNIHVEKGDLIQLKAERVDDLDDCINIDGFTLKEIPKTNRKTK